MININDTMGGMLNGETQPGALSTLKQSVLTQNLLKIDTDIVKTAQAAFKNISSFEDVDASPKNFGIIIPEIKGSFCLSDK